MSLDPDPLRTVYIDEHLDQAVCERAAARRASKARVFHRWLAAGIKASKRQQPPAVPEPLVPLHLKMVRMSPEVDHLLSVQALSFRVERNDLVRSYLTLGWRASEKAASRYRARRQAGTNAAQASEATQAS